MRKPLRLWPGVVAAALLVFFRVVLPVVDSNAALVGAIGGLVCAVAIVVWWLFFSRAAWMERIGAVVVAVVGVFVTFRVVDISIRTAAMGRMLPIYSMFVIPPALVAWAVVTRHRSDAVRRASMVVTLLLACGVFSLLRTAGVKGVGAE